MDGFPLPSPLLPEIPSKRASTGVSDDRFQCSGSRRDKGKIRKQQFLTPETWNLKPYHNKM